MYRFLVLASLFSALPLYGQTASAPEATSLPKDARKMLELAAPFYDYNSADMKPFHLRATYQLYDSHEQPGETGVFEYWYSSPDVHRTTFTRGGALHSDWHTAREKAARLDRGEGLTLAESKLEHAWFEPLPNLNQLGKLEPERTDVQLREKFNCVQLVPPMQYRSRDPFVQAGLFPTYCFDEHLPVLRLSYSFGGMVTQFNHIVKFRDKYLPKQIEMFENGRKVLLANLETVTTLEADAPALIPDPEAHTGAACVNLAGGLAAGMIQHKMPPVYPQSLKAAPISGTVVLQAVIGRDGAIHDLRVESAPSPSLAASALVAVKQWKYKPYILNGEPVEVSTTINVIFSIG